MRNLKLLSILAIITMIAATMMQCTPTKEVSDNQVENNQPEFNEPENNQPENNEPKFNEPEFEVHPVGSSSLTAIVYPRLPGEVGVFDPCAAAKQRGAVGEDEFRGNILVLEIGTTLCDMTEDQVNKIAGDYDPAVFCNCIITHCDEKQTQAEEFIKCLKK